MKKTTPIVGIAALLALSPPVLAQDDDDALIIEEIVVTATRVETNLMDTSIAVSAFSQEELTRSGVTDIRDATSLVPNFDVAFSPSDSGVQLTIRGINSNNFTEIGDPSVAFHVDGVYSPRPQGATALMFDLERLEVMRGPQGTLFGRNSAAGSVNLITAKPSTEGLFATYGGEIGNRGQRNVLGTVNVPITDTFAVRANFFAEQRDGFAHQDSGTKDLEGIGNSGPDGIPDMDQRWNRPVEEEDRYGNKDRWAMRVSGQWEPSDRLTARVTYEAAQDDSAGWPIAPDCERNPEICQFNGGGIDYIDPNVPGFMDMSNEAVRAHVDYALTENIDVVYNFGWALQKRRQQWDGDMGWRPLPGPTTGWLNRNQPWDDLYLATDSSHFESWSNELQFQGLTGRVNWILGFFDFREDNDIIFDVEIPFCCSTGALGGISFVQPERKLVSQAIFGQATWHITDRWHLTLGARYTEDTRTDNGGRNIGCFGGDNCSWSAGLIPNDGHPQGIVDELFLPEFTSRDLVQGMGSQNRFENYAVFDINDNRESFYNSNWRVGLDYDLNEDSLLYVYAATGSKAGSFGDGVDVCRCGRIEFFSFEPEEVLNYEIGYKTRLFDGRMNLVITAFSTEFEDKQVSQFRTVGFVEDGDGNIIQPPQEIGTLVTSNAGEASINGLEIEWDLIPWDNGRLTGGIGFLDAQFDAWPGYAGEAYFCDQRADAADATGNDSLRCVPQDDGSGNVDIEGNELPYSTPITVTVAYSHDFILASGASVSPYAKIHWKDETHFTEGNFDAIESLSDKRDAFGTLDLSVKYTSADEAWYVEAFVFNVTDERFPTYFVDSNQPNVPLFTWNEPRSWGVRAAYNIRP